MVRHNVALIAETSKIKDDELRRVEKVLQKRMRRDVAPIWDIRATIQCYRNRKEIADAWPIVVRDHIQQPGYASYHSDKNGAPFAMVEYSPDWPFMVSHDLLEMLIDPLANHFVNCPNPRSTRKGEVKILVEVCDPCADPANGYQLDGFKMADFCTPDYYRPKSAKGPFQFQRRGLEAPRGAAGRIPYVDGSGHPPLVAKGIFRCKAGISRLGSLRREPKPGGRTGRAASSRECDCESSAPDAARPSLLLRESTVHHEPANSRIRHAPK